MEDLPASSFKKETILLEDGRTLIFYDFTPDRDQGKIVHSSDEEGAK